MPKIAIISASIREGRASHRAALYFSSYITENSLGEVQVLDLQHFNFPLFEERLKYQKDPSAQVLAFTDTIRKASGVIIVTPEYNGGYPASLKNVIDLLYEDWYKKPIAIVAASDGSFGGTQVVTSLLFTLWKIKAWVVPPAFHVPHIDKAFDEHGVPSDKTGMDRRALTFLKEFFWAVNTNQNRQ